MQGGDRLPWVEWTGDDGKRNDNYEAFSSLDWQLHCYGEAPPSLRAACETAKHRSEHLSVVARRCSDAGLGRDALYLVRPDEYVGLATLDAAALKEYLDRHDVTGSQLSPPSTARYPSG